MRPSWFSSVGAMGGNLAGADDGTQACVSPCTWRRLAAMATVLVTGGSGFLGSWCIAGLLEQGHDVRTTIRDLKREPEVREAVGKQIDLGQKLSFAAADLS